MKNPRLAARRLFLRITSDFGRLTEESGVIASEDLCAETHRGIDLRLTETAICLLRMTQAFK